MATPLGHVDREMNNTNIWDQLSDLSDVPSLIDDYEFGDQGSLKPVCSPSSSDDGPETPTTREIHPNRIGRKANAKLPFAEHRLYYTEDESDGEDGLPRLALTPLTRIKALSCLELLPNEILQKIAAWVDEDADLRNLLLSSPLFSRAINDERSESWRLRFLARYDYPNVSSCYDFSAAYKLRRLVLQNFTSFTDGLNERTLVQLEVIRDMILETYFNPKPWLKSPVKSLNLLAMSNPVEAPWILTFLSIPFPGIREFRRYGVSHCLFETVQVVLSHLLLSPSSLLARAVTSSRDNYNIAKVYNFDQPFSMLYTRLPRERPLPKSPIFQSKTFPNLRSPEPALPLPQYKLDTSSLLHIRNFWHRHLIKDHYSMTDYTIISENTFSDMTQALIRMQKLPQKWDKALNDNIPFPTQWFGTYSCLHPWPKTRKDLEERQSCAEDWDHVDPMMLDCVTTSDYGLGFWPPEFSSIPVFRDTISEPPFENRLQDETTKPEGRSPPEKSRTEEAGNRGLEAEHGLTYIRGLASFIDTRKKGNKDNAEQDGQASSTSPTRSQLEVQEAFLKTHPFTSLRIRGVVHDISPESTVDNAPNAEDLAIPGWKRIVMVLYKPTVHYLVSVLEHAAEDYGGHSILDTATIWSATAEGDATTTTTQPPTSSGSVPAPAPTNTTTHPIDPAALHTHLQTRLYDLLVKHTPPSTPSHPDPFSTPNTIALEDAFSPPHYLSWSNDADIDFAYAYEGAVLPGSKIMMGRWWRCHGRDGLGDAREVDCNGDGIVFEPAADHGDAVQQPDDEPGDVVMGDAEHGETAATRTREFERGPFVFWCG